MLAKCSALSELLPRFCFVCNRFLKLITAIDGAVPRAVYEPAEFIFWHHYSFLGTNHTNFNEKRLKLTIGRFWTHLQNLRQLRLFYRQVPSILALLITKVIVVVLRITHPC
jgi:hypothetical protein